MTICRCLRHNPRLGRVREVVAVLLVTTGTLIGGLADSSWGQEKKPPETPQITVADRDLPFEHKLTLAKGKAARLTLPDGKDVAFWCRDGHPGLDDTGLALDWAEKPFQELEAAVRGLPDGATVLTGWKSYIRQGGVITRSGEHGSERELFVDKYRIVLKDTGAANGALPVTVQVRLATEDEMLFGDAKREHYLKQLKSADAAKRLEAVGQLCEMSFMGSIYAGDPKEIISAIRPLADDRDPKVKAAAEHSLFTLGDEQSLLALVTPEPKGQWRTRNGARQIADSCVRRESPAVSKQVLTFFRSKDEDLVAFAVTFFARVQDPISKPQMLAALKDNSPENRAEAVQAVRFLCEPEEAAKHIRVLLHDRAKPVVLAVLLEVSFLNHWIPAIEVTRLLKHDDAEIRRMAAYALDCCADLAAVDPLLEATKDADARVRGQAAVTLGRIATPKAYDRLLQLLRDESPEVRREAINGLRWLADRRAIPHIQELLKTEKDRDTRAMADRTVRELNQGTKRGHH